jgi:hypothetical protein
MSALLFWPLLTAAGGAGDALVGGVAWPSMQWAYIFSRTTTLCPARRATSVAGTPGVPAPNQAADPVFHRVGAVAVIT